MLTTRVRGRSFNLFALLVSSLLVLSMIPFAAGQGQGNGNGNGNSPIQAGYAIVTPDPPNADAGLVVFETFGERRGSETTQAGVLSTGLSDHWVLFTSTSGRLSRNLGVAIASPSAEAQIIMSLRDSSGKPVAPDQSFEVPTGSQVSKFVTEFFASQDLVSQDFTGTLDISSPGKPVGVVGLRFRGANFSTLPATMIGNTAPIPDLGGGIGGAGAVILPQFATGGGWASEIVVLNPTAGILNVRVDLFKQDGSPLDATLNGQTMHTFSATIDPGGVFVLSPGDSDF